ncbi:VENN motif pre-toxin domain-containing protein [Pectobacterium brasiliense]|uniref:VENN motif pre-toxin domain-containing protein n=1 Tax=Pectobacterium brasiliense TaxID=180957 RepID=UPI004044ACCC
MAGAAGAATGELAARVIADRLYPGKATSEMTESEKQTVTTLSLLAGGLAAGTVGDSTTNAVAGAQASQNAVDNNFLSTDENRQRLSEMSSCGSDSACKDGVTEKFKKISDEQIKSVENCSSVDVCVVKAKEMAELQADYGQRIEELGEKLRANGRLSGADLEEWTYLHIVTPALEAGRIKAIHNAQAVGGSDEASQLAINTIAQAGATSAAGIIGGASKAGHNIGNGTSQVTTKNVDPSILISRQNKNEMSGSQVKRLVKDMKANGFDINEPVDVAIVNGKAIIIDGHHRAEAAAKAGIKDIPVRIHEVTKEQGDQLLREAAEARVRY